ncbi:MAG: hormogonium polysaccharide biosynthesis protein HpsA, partial [Aphanizomenon sp.]
NAGFVLPTVTMVSVVVVLLTTAIMFRSFDRAKNASNVRVNQMVMNSAAPAIDRAKAKLNKLFKDQRLSRATPTETEIDNVLVTYKDEYTFGDERNLIVNCYDPSSGLNQGICSSAEILKTAWQFPIDTDNNGRFDSYTLYGIYYKNPALSGTSLVKRNTVQARAIPMTITSAGGNCPSTAISASLAGVNGWFKDNKSLSLVKGFFVYTVTVPITSTENLPNNPPYERATNSKGFSALEYEQDKIKRSLLNNAVIYQDDLYLTAEDADFKLNGGIFTNGNLLAGSTSGKSISIYQVSSLNSCFYDPDNAKITVVKNIGTIPGANGSTSFDLFAGKGVTPTQTTSLTSARDRFSIAQNLDAGSTDRNGYWELAAAKVPDNPQDPVGGLRVVTGAGIYLRTGDTAPLANINFTAALPTIYDRPLPEPPDNTSPDANTPYLKMRASAVYHYKQADYSQTAPEPIACVNTTHGLPNNGIVYGPPTKSVSYYEEVLKYQSTLKYDDGRSIDDGLLAGALAATNRTLSQQSTIDAAICALEILDGSEPTNTVIPDGAISEKKVETSSSTVLNLGLLKGQKIGGTTPSQEYLIPNSGIIYATRDDALVDKNKNAIILTNGSDISRESSYRDAEKGLIVATNLPLYIKGDFNLHTQ